MINSSPENDSEIVGKTIGVLHQAIRLLPFIERMKEIVRDRNHPLFVDQNSSLNENQKEFMSVMRMAQLGALVHLISVMQKTTLTAIDEIPKMEQSEKDKIIDRAMKDLGI